MEKVALMSPEWAAAYAELWNSHTETREGSADLDMLIEMKLADRDGRAAHIDIKQGEVVYGGPPLEGRKPDFKLTATVENWKRVATGEMNPVTAITVRKIHFVGPLRVAMSHMPALNKGMILVGEVEGLDWDA